MIAMLLIDSIENDRATRWLREKIIRHKSNWNINPIAPARIESFNLTKSYQQEALFEIKNRFHSCLAIVIHL